MSDQDQKPDEQEDQKPDEQEDKKRDETADALRAMAGGAEPGPIELEEAQQQVEADNIEDDADALAGITGKGSVPGLAQDAFGDDSSDRAAASLAAAARLAGGGPDEQAEGPAEEGDEETADADDRAAAALAAADLGTVDLAAELAAQAEGRPGLAGELTDATGAPPADAAEAAAASIFPQPPGAPPTPEQKRARAAQFDMRTRRTHAYQFKKTMIPLLIVVSVLLLIMGTAAVFVPVEAATSGADAAPTISRMKPYRVWMILSAFVVGPVLLLGAWMFHRDIQRSDRELALRTKQSEAEVHDRLNMP